MFCACLPAPQWRACLFTAGASAARCRRAATLLLEPGRMCNQQKNSIMPAAGSRPCMIVLACRLQCRPRCTQSCESTCRSVRQMPTLPPCLSRSSAARPAGPAAAGAAAVAPAAGASLGWRRREGPIWSEVEWQRCCCLRRPPGGCDVQALGPGHQRAALLLGWRNLLPAPCRAISTTASACRGCNQTT